MGKWINGEMVKGKAKKDGLSIYPFPLIIHLSCSLLFIS
jgi:hypothetical protein